MHIIAFLAWSSFFAVPPLALMSYYLEGPMLITQSLESATWHAWTIVLWQTIGNTLIEYGLWNLLLQRHAAALVALWTLLVPVFGMAAILIIAGLVINFRSTKTPITLINAL